MNVIIDSCVFISFYDLDDSNHERAIVDLEKITDRKSLIWVTEHILDEVVNILLKRSYKKQLHDFLRLIEKNQVRIFVPKNQKQSLDLTNKTILDVLRQKRKKASYTDLYSVVLVEGQLLNDCKILSYDHHFDGGVLLK